MSKPPRPPAVPPHVADTVNEILDEGRVYVSPRLAGVAFVRDRRSRTYTVRSTATHVVCDCDTHLGTLCPHAAAAMVVWCEAGEDESDEFDRQRAACAELDAELEEALGWVADDAAAVTNRHVDPVILNENGYHKVAAEFDCAQHAEAE